MFPVLSRSGCYLFPDKIPVSISLLFILRPWLLIHRYQAASQPQVGMCMRISVAITDIPVQERTLFVGLISCCVLLLFAVIWYVQRRRHLFLEKEEELEALRHLMHETEGDNGGVKNDKFVKKMLLQQLALIRMVATNPSSDHQELLVQMGKIANKDVVTDDLLVWDDLYKTIDLVYDGFHTRIHRKYGDLLNEKEDIAGFLSRD